MPDFVQFIRVNGEPLSFSFSLVLIPGGHKYHVSVLKNSRIETFEIAKDQYSNWKIQSPAPEWVHKIEKELQAIIRSGLH